MKFRKMLNEEKIQFFFSCGGLCPPAPPTEATPLDPACFWIENSSRNRFALNGIQRIACFTVFFCITRKIKIGKIWNLVFLSIQPIPDLPCRFDHFWIFISKVVKFTWKMQNLLNRKKKSDFSDFYFSSYGHFCFKKRQFSINFSRYLDK